LRWPLRLIPDGAVVRVVQGPLWGRRMVACLWNHGCRPGSYERTKQGGVTEGPAGIGTRDIRQLVSLMTLAGMTLYR